MEGRVNRTHCLFCQDKIIPFSLSVESEAGGGGESENEKVGLWKLCVLVGIPLGEVKRLEEKFGDGGEELERWGICEQFLCFGCFEWVDQLERVWRRVEELRRKIREVVVRGKHGECEEEDVGGFVQEFRVLVEKSGTEVDETRESAKRTGRNIVTRLSTRKLKNSLDSTTTTDSNEEPGVNPEKNEEEEEPDVKIEVPEDSADQLEKEELDLLMTEFGGTEIRNQKQDQPILSVNPAHLPAQDIPTNPENLNEANERVPPEGSPYPISPKPKRKRRHRGTSSSTPLIPPTRKKKKRKSRPTSDSAKHSCRTCAATFTSIQEYYAHRRTHKFISPKSLNIKTIYDSTKKRVVARLCSVCGAKVKAIHLGGFLEHMLSHEPTSTSFADTQLYSCDLCDKKYCLKLNLDLHKICHHEYGQYILKCEHCDDSSASTQQELVTHLKSHGDSVYICKSCPIAYSTLDKVLAHMVKHSKSKRFICPVCPLEFGTLKDLYQHCQQVHPNLKENFGCPQCPKQFLMPSTLKQHLRISHGVGEENPTTEHYCQLCNNGKSYKTKGALDRHLKLMHGDSSSKPHKCPNCDKAFIYKSHLVKHVEEKHNKIRYPCPHCPKSYSEQIQLGYHLRTHTGEGLYTCTTCGKQFPRLGQLKIHSVVHLEKNSQTSSVCEVCGKEFLSALHLAKHKNSHKEKKLECEYCHQKFRRPDHLRGHLRTHTGERPYTCPTCKKSFNRRDILLVHMKMHGYSLEEASKAYDGHQESLKQESLTN